MNQKKPKLMKITGKMETEADRLLVEWLQENLMPEKRKNRKPRTLHLYLEGPPGIGKSRLANQLREVLSVYDIPGEKWNDGYQDGAFDMLLYDEFNGQKSIQEMNVMTDGYITPLVRRNQPPYLKKDILPAVVISNKSPEGVYHNLVQKDQAYVDAFKSRYLHIRIDNKIDVLFESEQEEKEKEKEKEIIVLESDEELEERINKKGRIEIPDDVFDMDL